jgi:hypothetical protein
LAREVRLVAAGSACEAAWVRAGSACEIPINQVRGSVVQKEAVFGLAGCCTALAPAWVAIYYWRRTIPEFRREYFKVMDFRRFDHIDEMLDVARGRGNDVLSKDGLARAKQRIAVLQWLIAHDGSVASVDR